MVFHILQQKQLKTLLIHEFPIFLGFELVQCGVFARSAGTGGVNSGGNANYHGLGQANGNAGFNRRYAYLAGQTGSSSSTVANDGGIKKMIGVNGMRNVAQTPTSGISAWGIITLIVFVILIGFCGYYGIICYPLFFTKQNRYDHMNVSTTTTTSTPTRSSEFGKISEYDDDFQYKISNDKSPNPSHNWAS